MIPNFECGYCGKTYENEEEYVNCVNRCYKKRIKEAEEARRKQLADAKEKRKQEIIDAYSELNNLVESWGKDYNEISPVLISPSLNLGKFFW